MRIDVSKTDKGQIQIKRGDTTAYAPAGKVTIKTDFTKAANQRCSVSITDDRVHNYNEPVSDVYINGVQLTQDNEGTLLDEINASWAGGGDIVLKLGSKIFGTNSAGEQHELIGLNEYPGGEQIEVGSPAAPICINSSTVAGWSDDPHIKHTHKDLDGVSRDSRLAWVEELDAVANAQIHIGAYWFGKTQAGTAVPNPTLAEQNYFDFTTNTPYTAKADLSGWDAGTALTVVNGNVIDISSYFFDITEGQLRGTAIFSTSGWGYFPIKIEIATTLMPGVVRASDSVEVDSNGIMTMIAIKNQYDGVSKKLWVGPLSAAPVNEDPDTMYVFTQD